MHVNPCKYDKAIIQLMCNTIKIKHMTLRPKNLSVMCFFVFILFPVEP